MPRFPECRQGTFLLSLLAVSAIPALFGQQPAIDAAPYGSHLLTWEDFTPKATSLGQRREVVDQPTATFQRMECHITTLNPGKFSHPPHHHNDEEFIILKEGTVDVSINGHIQRAGPGSLFFFASNDVHNLHNVGDAAATYIAFKLTTPATKSVPSAPASESAAPNTLRSQCFDWDKLIVKPTKTGARRDIANSPTVTWANFEVHATTLNPGEAPHPPHHHPDEEIVVVKEGIMEATVAGQTRRGGPGSIFFYGSNDEHGMKNVGTTAATYHVIRVVTTPLPAATGRP